jgi:hypothetical protein
MSDSFGGYAVANRKSGEYVSKAVPTLAEAQKLLETFDARYRDSLMIRQISSRPPEPKMRVGSDSFGYSNARNTPDGGDNSPG